MTKCQSCGMEFDGKYVEYNTEKCKDVYKCSKCYGLNYFDVEEDEDE